MNSLGENIKIEKNKLNKTESEEKENKMENTEKYTVIRVKRKTTDDPERALTINCKKVPLSYILYES